MSVVRTGLDIVEVARMAAAMNRHGQALLDRVFTSAEQAYCGRKKHAAVHFAARFAAKEASSKALGTGIGKDAAWLDLEVTHDSQGAPEMSLHGAAAKFAAEQEIAKIHISLSHTEAYAVASAIAVR